MPIVLRSKSLKTRRAHKCHGCQRAISVGERVEAQTCVFEGRAYTLYTCTECERLFAMLPHDYFDPDEGVPQGWARDVAREGVI